MNHGGFSAEERPMNEFGKDNTAAKRKLTNAQVRELKELHHTGEWTQGRLAKHFGISAMQAGRIVRGESRNNVVTPTEAKEKEAEREAQRTSEIERGLIKSLHWLEMFVTMECEVLPDGTVKVISTQARPAMPDPFDHAGPGEDEPLAVSGLEKLQQDAKELKKSDLLLDELEKDLETEK
jgi:hypothetical protein